MPQILYIYEAESPSELLMELGREISSEGLKLECRSGRLAGNRDGCEALLEILPPDLSPFKCQSIAFIVVEQSQENVCLAWELLLYCTWLRPARVWLWSKTYSLDHVEGMGICAVSIPVPGSGDGCIVDSESLEDL